MDGGIGWYSHLDEVPVVGLGATVEVIGVSLGWIGAFTRSPLSGRWHLAELEPHWHLAGN